MPVEKRLGAASSNALYVVWSLTIAQHRNPGCSKALTIKISEDIDNARKPHLTKIDFESGMAGKVFNLAQTLLSEPCQGGGE